MAYQQLKGRSTAAARASSLFLHPPLFLFLFVFLREVTPSPAAAFAASGGAVIAGFAPTVLRDSDRLKCSSSRRPPAARTLLLPHLYSSSGEVASCTNYEEANPANAGGDVEESSSFLDRLLSRFQGDFDNYSQVLSDRSEGKKPREGGGHEHIHCTLVPLTDDLVATIGERVGCRGADGGGTEAGARLAAFYFDGLPERIFRLRLYVLRSRSGEEGTGRDAGEEVDMKLYTLHPQAERALRSASSSPERWGAILSDELATGFRHGNDASPSPFAELKGCDVRWSSRSSPSTHPYAYPPHRTPLPPNAAHHATMIEGSAVVDSTMIPGTKLLIKDELSLWENEFWINDRGYDPKDGKRIVYGNWAGVPYKMERVTNNLFKEEDDGSTVAVVSREVTHDELAWTLGDHYRSKELYAKRMDAMGGPSTKLNLPQGGRRHGDQNT